MRDMVSVSLVDRRGYLTVVVEIEGQDNLVVRRPENLREWYNNMQRMVKETKTKEMQSTEEFWAKKPPKISQNMEALPGVFRGRICGQYQYTDRQERPSLAGSLDRMRRWDKSKNINILRS